MVNFTVFGIDLGISVGFVAVITFMLYVDRTGLMLPTLEAVLSHEAGHIIMLMAFGFRPKRIRLQLGTVAVDGKYFLNPIKEGIMLFAGPLLNIIFFCFLFMGYKYCSNISLLNRSLVMLVVGIINLLPIKGLDGGGILSLILEGHFKLSTAVILEKTVSLIFVLLVFALGVYVFITSGQNPSLIIFAIYLFVCSYKK